MRQILLSYSIRVITLIIICLCGISVFSQTKVSELNKQLEVAITNDDLPKIKNLIEKQCVDPNAVVRTEDTFDVKPTALYVATVYGSTDANVWRKPNAEIVRYLLERGASQQLAFPTSNTTLIKQVEYWLESATSLAQNTSAPANDRRISKASIPYLRAVLEVLKNPPTVKRVTNCGQTATKEDELLNLMDWTEDFMNGTGRIIKIKNLTMKNVLVDVLAYDCKDTAIAQCGERTNILIPPGVTYEVMSVLNQLLTNAPGIQHSKGFFRYKYWGRFEK